ncbi:ribbon-helix-helix protein, CopG family [Kamptonema cortianum]|nr:ribbon-helix-helix protein, CopG family [Oscillatoria laete-virens]MDK3157175.1 ribbon-helix-helix protein, CopG family [Kamptonema cortianum]MDL5051151.1 ribbon-helix-helix protein, CopG family [Oscillatoria amoena NRMC-F 0135]MDL5055057.1 ribbon-helix-helix protein, CopG family [Oscillatoria laete-virens NRMC-F 0139]
MKVVTLNVNEDDYRLIQQIAQREKRSTSDVVREAMHLYLAGRRPKKTSLRDWKPSSCGKVLKPLSRDDDIFGEMYSLYK